MTIHVGSLPRPSDLVELYRDDAPDHKLSPRGAAALTVAMSNPSNTLNLIGMTFGRLTGAGRPIYSSETIDETV
jgi:hypothetical protein